MHFANSVGNFEVSVNTSWLMHHVEGFPVTKKIVKSNVSTYTIEKMPIQIQRFKFACKPTFTQFPDGNYQTLRYRLLKLGQIDPYIRTFLTF